MNSPDPLRVLIAHAPPVTCVEGTEKKQIFSGFLVDLLPELLQRAGVATKLDYVVVEAAGGLRLPNGSWTGVMGHLTRREADFALFPLTLTQQRALAIDYTPPYFSDGYGILKPKAEDMKNFRIFLAPFDKYTWLALLCAMVFVGLLMCVLDKYTGRVRRQTNERLALHRRVAASQVHRHLFNSVVSCVGFGKEPRTASWAIRILWLTWLIFSVILMSAYTANLAAALTLTRFTGGIETLEELRGRPFAVLDGTSIAAYFQTSMDSTARAMEQQMRLFDADDLAGAVQSVRDGSTGAYISDFSEVQYLSQTRPCTLTTARETFGPGQLVIGLPHKSPLTAALTTAMLELGETGKITEVRRKWLIENSDCPKSSTTLEDNSLAITQVYSIFLMLAVGAVVAVCYGIGECLYFRRLRDRLDPNRTPVGTVVEISTGEVASSTQEH